MLAARDELSMSRCFSHQAIFRPEVSLAPWVPVALRENFMRPTTAPRRWAFRFDRCYEKLKSRYWPDMGRDLKMWLKACSMLAL